MPDGVTLGPEDARLLVRRSVLVLLAFAVAGAAAGVVWEWVWTPPTGVVVKGEYILDGNGVRDSFSGTAWYVVLAVLTGLLLGVLVAVSLEGWELVTLVLVTMGSVLAAWLMFAVGTALDPPDPVVVAERSKDLSRVPDELSVSGASPHIAFPSGALLGLAVVYVGLAGRRRPAG